MQHFRSLVETIAELIVHSLDALQLLIKGWTDLPGEIGVFLHALGPAGDVFSVVLYLCVGFLVFKLLISIIELIPGF